MFPIYTRVTNRRDHSFGVFCHNKIVSKAEELVIKLQIAHSFPKPTLFDVLSTRVSDIARFFSLHCSCGASNEQLRIRSVFVSNTWILMKVIERQGIEGVMIARTAGV